MSVETDALERTKTLINKHISEVIEAHHLAYVYEDPDVRGPKGGKILWYVCSCNEAYERKRFADHQVQMLMLP
jgi:hypothetical protein